MELKRALGARVSEEQKETLERVHRYGALSREALRKSLGLSREAARCRVRRLGARKLVERGILPGDLPYVALSAKGARALGAQAPRAFGPAGIWCRVAIAEACVTEGFELLSDEELLLALKELEHLFGALALPGLPRRRWRIDSSGEIPKLSFLEVELPAAEPVPAQEIVRRLERRVGRLARRSPGWRRIAQSHLSLTLLTPYERRAEILAATRSARLNIPLHVVRVALLQHATRALTEAPQQ